MTLPSPFPWPHGARAAVALTYDDALPGHYETVAPVLAAAGLPSTFYVPVTARLLHHADAWRSVAALGHELGNHTCFHPCRRNPNRTPPAGECLDEYTVERWAAEVDLASAALHLLDGQSQRSYGNTCHQETVGPAEAEISLRPAIADRFTAGRGLCHDAGWVGDPWTADLASLGTSGGDGRSATELLARVDRALATGGFLILTFHSVGPRDYPRLHIAAAEHAALVAGLIARRPDVWTTTVSSLATALRQGRGQ